MIGAILGILDSVLGYITEKERKRYTDKFIELKKAIYAEENKPDSERSDAVLDNLKFELRLFSFAVASELRKTNS